MTSCENAVSLATVDVHHARRTRLLTRDVTPSEAPNRTVQAATRCGLAMVGDGGFAARQCTVIDISDGGARFRVEDTQFVKPQFQLKFDRTSPGRPCKVAWKKGDAIGVKFV
jgi:hypothetical protein